MRIKNDAMIIIPEFQNEVLSPLYVLHPWIFDNNISKQKTVTFRCIGDQDFIWDFIRYLRRLSGGTTQLA